MLTLAVGGCAQISAPTGGAKDTLAPVLLKSEPANYSTNFSGNKIILTFDEYINVENISENVLVSPLQKNNPIISYNFRTVTVRLRDTLLPNTTYSINFGNALKDLNESIPFENFTYIFSTGNNIDSFSQEGKVVLAESGKTDSTLIATLYRDLNDTAVQKHRPLYIAKVKSDGSFKFNNIPAGTFRLYALRDGDGGKTYNSKTEAFAFIDSTILIGEENPPRTLYAYEEVKTVPNTSIKKTLAEKRLRYTTSLMAQAQDITQPLEISFNNAVKDFDEKKIVLLDTNNLAINNTTFTFDSTRKKVQLKTTWLADYDYALVIPKDAVEDSSGNVLLRSDTILFTTKKLEDYGSVVLRFKNIDLTKNPVIQFISAESVKFSFPLTGNEWSGKMFMPGEYELRILYDTNNNGHWDPGNYAAKIQPETA
ncbi:MAG TPA: Ig-like domain-containing domain, partial [Ferruginibacter sp.]|nr:Ig-like domain-containing domain [Ferruginibacter sp.]